MTQENKDILLKLLKQHIQALIDTREEEDMEVFMNCMSRLHCQHLRHAHKSGWKTFRCMPLAGG